jgi:hypothetical protein
LGNTRAGLCRYRSTLCDNRFNLLVSAGLAAAWGHADKDCQQACDAKHAWSASRYRDAFETDVLGRKMQGALT